MIRFEGVTKAYPDGTVAVDDLSFEAPRGQITALVGPSGSGKTTTLRMINRMIEPTSGRILLDGDDIMQKNAAQLRRGIGYVIQHGGLFPHRRVVDNVTTVPRLLGWSASKARGRAMEVLELVGLDPALAKRYPHQLSGGQQQRVGVARALAADPELVLMDEPFSAVDPVVRDQLQADVQRLQRELGTTVVIVTHDIDEALRLGDQVAVLRTGGRLAQIAEPAELLARPADPFVAEFVGRDRGYLALGFRGGDVRVDRSGARVITLGASVPPRSTWTLVVDGARQPLGWVHGDDVGGRPVGEADLRLGGTLATQSGSLRSMLDASLSSPSGLGVVTDDAGALVGTVRAADVLEVIEAQRREQPVGAAASRGRAPR